MNILITTAGHKLNSFHLTVMNVMTTRKTLVNHLFATPEGAFVKDGMWHHASEKYLFSVVSNVFFVPFNLLCA